MITLLAAKKHLACWVRTISCTSGSSSDFHLFNSKSGKKEKFVPKVPGKVGIYMSGVTPYDYSHVGHARSCVAMDVLVRY